MGNMAVDTVANTVSNRMQSTPMLVDNQVFVPIESWEHLKYLIDKSVQMYHTLKVGEALIAKKNVSYQGDLEEWYKDGKSLGYIIRGASQFILIDGMWMRQPEHNIVTLTKENFEARVPHADSFIYQTVKKAAY